MLAGHVSVPCWRAMLAFLIGVLCWRAILAFLIGGPCWRSMLEFYVGGPCWRTSERIACGIRFYVGEDVAVKIGDGVVGQVVG